MTRTSATRTCSNFGRGHPCDRAPGRPGIRRVAAARRVSVTVTPVTQETQRPRLTAELPTTTATTLSNATI
jgi:hypothetical protein